MNRISDALELLTAHHEEIDGLLAVIASADAATRELALTVVADRLGAHLAVEHEVLYPSIAPVMSPDTLREVRCEQVEIMRVLAELMRLGGGDPRFTQRLDQLRTLIAGHAGWQEEELFTAAAEEFGCDELATIGGMIRAWPAQPARAFAAPDVRVRHAVRA